MKIKFIFLVITLVFPLLVSSTALAVDNYGYYLRAGTGLTYSELDSGGLNTAGPHPNTGSDQDNRVLLDLSLGKGWGALRTQIDYSFRHSDFRTNSFQPPTPTFFYLSSVLTKTISLSTYYDLSFGENGFYEPFLGAGAGGTYYDVEVSDGVVFASDSDTSLSYFGTVGIGFKHSEQVKTELGYRYYDFGEFDVDLFGFGGLPAGNFEGDLIAHEVFVGVRYMF
ncbi:MAG: hypothetical protein C0623_06675 [Desulfuromonas sp.]|nr:MAG: hypothetical protein C0623_06675 [Desulfuromonas sp.]